MATPCCSRYERSGCPWRSCRLVAARARRLCAAFDSNATTCRVPSVSDSQAGSYSRYSTTVRKPIRSYTGSPSGEDCNTTAVVFGAAS